MQTSQTLTIGIPQKLPPHRYYDHLTPENNRSLEDMQCDAFVGYVEERTARCVVLKHPAEKKFIVKRAIESTRNHPSGREKTKRKIHDCLGSYPVTFGILLTPTTADPDNKSGCYEGMSRPDAWQGIGYRCRALMDEINKWRKRHGYKKVRAYIKVVEDQKDRLYPCPHIWFPGLKYLAPIGVIQKLWPYGNVDLKLIWDDSPANYITKYISKMEGREFMQAMMWAYNLRLYSTSRDFQYIYKDRPDSGWRFASAGGKYSIEEEIRKLVGEGYISAGSGSPPLPDS